MNIKVLTDTVSDLDFADVHKYAIGLLPLHVHFGEESFVDKFELNSEQFFEKLAQSKVNPTTSQVSIGSFLETFERELESHDLVVYISVSDKLSGTFGAAQLAAKQIDSPKLLLFDSGHVSFSQGMIVLAFCRRLHLIHSKDEALRYLAILRNDLQSFYILDTLEYLIRGGRVSKLKGTFGTFLGVKPILSIADGQLFMYKKARGMKRAMQEVINSMKAIMPEGKLGRIGLFDAKNRPDLEQFRQMITEQFEIEEVLASEVGSVIGTHAGPGAIAVSFFKDCNL